MHAINEFVVKVASRCNLNCDYCYEYNTGDETWRDAAHFMEPDVALQLARRIADHAFSHALDCVTISMHGGEPLLLGPIRMEEIVTCFRSIETDRLGINLGLQTNGVLLTPQFAALFRRLNVAVSVSIDGDGSANDRHRVDHQGRSSFDLVVRGIECLQEHAPECLFGLLAVIDVRNDPLTTLDSIGRFGVPDIDFLLPHKNWEKRPYRPTGDAVAYGRWLFEVFRAWSRGRQSHLRIRLLEHIVRRLVGGPGLFEQMTLDPVTLAIVTTDGDIEAVDSIKATASGVQRLGMNVADDSFDRVIEQPIIAARQIGREALCDICQECPKVQVCSGGYFSHRWKNATGFQNPSVYCSDLTWLIDRMSEDIAETAPIA